MLLGLQPCEGADVGAALCDNASCRHLALRGTLGVLFWRSPETCSVECGVAVLSWGDARGLVRRWRHR